MCGPVNDEKAKAAREKFLDDVSDRIAATLEDSGKPFLDGDETISIPDRPWPKRKNKKRWTH